jgi:hypothetical protein
MLGYYEKPDEIKTLKYPIFIDFFDTARHYEKPWKTINLETSNQQVEGSIPSGVAIFTTATPACARLTWSSALAITISTTAKGS